MTQWIKMERLSGNDLPVPAYHTAQSVAFDLAACLKRPCARPRSRFGEKCRFDYFYPSVTGQRISVESADSAITFENVGDLFIRPGETILVSTGFKVEFPATHALFIHVRSSTGVHGLTMANGTAVIDADFRGELYLPLYNRTSEDIIVPHGYRVCQAEHTVINRANILEAEVSETERGAGGFGSTG